MNSRNYSKSSKPKKPNNEKITTLKFKNLILCKQKNPNKVPSKRLNKLNESASNTKKNQNKSSKTHLHPR